MITWYRSVYAACIMYLSVRTMMSATAISDHHFWLGGAEAAGAALFVFGVSRRVGFALLLVVYAIVAVHETLGGNVPAAIILYAVAAASLSGLGPRGGAGVDAPLHFVEVDAAGRKHDER